MRKRQQYTHTKSRSKVPTLIIMSLTLFCILYFGKSFSQQMASIFAPSIPVSDAPKTPADQSHDRADLDIVPAESGVEHTSPSGFILAAASKSAAQNILILLSKGSNP